MDNQHMCLAAAAGAPWIKSCSSSQAHNCVDAGQGTHLAALTAADSPKAASWDLYDHSSLLECRTCTQGSYTTYGGGRIHLGSFNMMDGELMQDFQHQTDEEEDMCMGMETKMMKKRKLTNEQAKQLEASFEADKKLEAEKKQRLATQLGLQPRQVAVWFQNRRARSKTKQLEIDFLALKADYDRVLAQRRSLQAEVSRLTTQLKTKILATKAISCSQDSTSSTNSNNGDVVSESTTLNLKMDSPTKEQEDLSYNTNKEIDKTKDGGSRLQGSTRYSNMNTYDWESYDNGLWVFE